MNLLLAVSWLNLTLDVERLGWVLLHSLWQFALVALLAGVTVRALRRRSASTRYVVLVSAMAVSVVVPAATWMLRRGAASGQWTSREVSAAMPDTADEASRHVPPSNLGDDPTLASAVPLETPIPGHAASLAAIPEVPRGTSTDGVIAPSGIKQARTILQPWLAWIVAGWSLGVVICSLRPLLGWHTLRRLRRVGVAPVADEVLSATQRLSKRLRLRRAVLVLQSTLARTPIVVGYVRPVILLPVSLLSSIPVAQLEAILAHELAHVRRHDFVVNLLQTLVETLFFYHPAMWWLSRQIRIEREHCCDDQVVALLGNRVEYGRALVAVKELQGRRLILALGVNDGSLLARIRRIVGVESDCTPHERWPAALLGLVLLGAMCALSITWSVAAPDDVRHEPQPVVGPTPEREKGQLAELVGWSADSAQVFTTSTFNRLMRWERSGTALKLKASEIPGNEAFAHANSMAVAGRSGLIVLGTNRGTVQFWDADSLQVQKQISVEPETDRYPTYAVAISPDESVVAEFGWSGHLYDMATMKSICLFGEREKRRMSVLAFSPDGRTLVGLDWDGLLTLWNIPDGTKIADWSLQHISQHATVQWSQEGDLIAVVSDGAVAFVTPTVGSTPQVVVAPDAVCQMTPEDTLIESSVRRPDLPAGIDFAGVMALAPDFKTVASVKIDASVAIWDVETREVISHLAPPPSAHKTAYAGVYMRRLAFSPNGRHLACTRKVEGDVIWWTLNTEPADSNTNRDPQSNKAAGSADPHQTQVLASIPDAEYKRPTADDQTATAMIPADAWGSPVNGLRAAILIQSPPVDQKDSLRYRLVVENVGHHDIRFSATVAPDFRDFHIDLCTLSLFGLDDEPLPREKPVLVSYLVQPRLIRLWLKAGERAYVRRDGRMALSQLDPQGLPVTHPPQRASAFFKVRPGRYSVRATVELGRETRSTSPAGIPTVLSPAKGEWSGKLKTGTLPVALFEDSGGVTQSPGRDAHAAAFKERTKAYNAALLSQTLVATPKYLATAKPERPELMVGEPGWIQFDVRNQTDIDQRLIVGGDYRNALGRPDSFKIDVFDADGRRVAQPSIGIDMGGISYPMPLPAKDSAEFKLFLPHWATITKPGRYRFRVWRELHVIPSEKDSAGQDAFALKPDEVLVAAETEFTVVARDESKFGKLIERLGPQLLSKNSDDAERADEILRAIRVPLEWSQRATSIPDAGEVGPDERAVPWYVRYLAQTHSARKRNALRFLGECRSETAFEAIAKSLEVTADDIRNTTTRALAVSSANSVHHAAAHALATFAANQPTHGHATQRVFGLAEHPHMPVRMTVLHFAAKVNTPQSRAMIDTMTNDTDQRVADEAKRYQKLLADEDG